MQKIVLFIEHFSLRQKCMYLSFTMTRKSQLEINELSMLVALKQFRNGISSKNISTLFNTMCTFSFNLQTFEPKIVRLLILFGEQFSVLFYFEKSTNFFISFCYLLVSKGKVQTIVFFKGPFSVWQK